jgi:hypothetical protein
MLKIKNPDDIKGMNFVDGRFVLRRVEIHDDRYRFEFKETSRWVYIDLFRKPIWNSEENRNMYEIDNGTGAQHKVSADWFGQIKNMKWTFNQALKDL